MKLARAAIVGFLLVAGPARADPSAPADLSDPIVRAGGVLTLDASLPAPGPSLAQRLAAQLERLRAEVSRRDRTLERLREEGRLAHVGTPEELERYRQRELAAMRRDGLVEELELSRLGSGLDTGERTRARGELERARHRLELTRAIDRVLERVAFERRLAHLDRTLARKRAAELRLQSPGALRSFVSPPSGVR